MSLPKIKSKDKKQRIDKKIAKLNKFIPKPPFRWLICGATRSGKTTLLCNLFDKGFYGKLWKKENIIVISRTCRIDDKIKSLPSDNFFEEWDDSILDEIVEQQEFFKLSKKTKVPHVLIILDDMLGTAGLSISSSLNKFLHISRHYNISILILTQRYTGCPRQMRLNMSHISIFQPILGEMESILVEHSSKSTKKKMEEKFMDIYAEPFTFIHIDYTEYDMNKRYRKGLDEPLNLFNSTSPE